MSAFKIGAVNPGSRTSVLAFECNVVVKSDLQRNINHVDQGHTIDV